MSLINVWISVRNSEHVPLRVSVGWKESERGTYVGPVSARTWKLFRRMGDFKGTQHLWNVRTSNLFFNWHLWSIWIEEDELDAEMAELPVSTYKVVGAWYWYGEQVPGYPILPTLLRHMPPTLRLNLPPTPATTLSDVNLSQGQSPRRFT